MKLTVLLSSPPFTRSYGIEILFERSYGTHTCKQTCRPGVYARCTTQPMSPSIHYINKEWKARLAKCATNDEFRVFIMPVSIEDAEKVG